VTRPAPEVVDEILALVGEAEVMAEQIRWRVDRGLAEEALDRLRRQVHRWQAIDDRLGECREELRELEAA